jgi:hypothetical protein
MAAVSIWLPATPGKGKGNIIQDATGELTIPFRAWLHLGLGSTAIVLGLALLGASLVAAWKLRHRLPEVALWVLFDAVLLVCSDEGVAERPLNLARVAAMALPAVGLALVAERHPTAGDARPAMAGAARGEGAQGPG